MTDMNYPQQNRKSFIFEISVAVFLLALYGHGGWRSRTAQHDLFIPTDTYLYITEILAILLSAYLATQMVRKKSLEAFSLFSHFNRIIRIALYMVLPFALYYIFVLSSFGFGELVTENMGQQIVSAYDVTKDPNQERWVQRRYISRRHHMAPAHCLLSDQFANAVLPEEYCIDRSQYDALKTGRITVNFSARKSMVGTVLKNYNRPDLPRR